MDLFFRNNYDDASAVVCLPCSSSTPKRNTNEQEEVQSHCAGRCFTNLNFSNKNLIFGFKDVF